MDLLLYCRQGRLVASWVVGSNHYAVSSDSTFDRNSHFSYPTAVRRCSRAVLSRRFRYEGVLASALESVSVELRAHAAAVK